MQGTVYLALDADNAGKTATSRASRMAAQRSTDLRVVAMPAGRDPVLGGNGGVRRDLDP